MPAAIYLGPDPDVLTGLVVKGPAPAGLYDQGGRALGLGVDLDDSAAKLTGAPQRIEQV